MKEMLIKYFIPHPGNDHKPHALRSQFLLGLVLAVLLIEALFFSYIFLSKNTRDYLAAVLPGVLVSLTNQTRIETSLDALSSNTLLQQAAQLKANDMATKGYFAHTSPEGHEPWYWLDQVGYVYSYAGENLAVNFIDSDDVTDAWMKSPSHRANIINQNYTEIGIAVASGIYKGKNTVFVAQFFGTPSVASIPKPPTTYPTDQYAIASTPQTAPPPVVVSPIPQSSVPQKSVLGSETDVGTSEAQVESVLPQPELIPSTPAVAPVVSIDVTEDSSVKTLEKISTSPRTVANFIFASLMMLTTIALALAVFIAIRVQHPSMIAGAVAVIVFMAGVIYFNEFILSGGVELPNTVAATVIRSF